MIRRSLLAALAFALLLTQGTHAAVRFFIPEQTLTNTPTGLAGVLDVYVVSNTEDVGVRGLDMPITISPASGFRLTGVTSPSTWDVGLDLDLTDAAIGSYFLSASKSAAPPVGVTGTNQVAFRFGFAIDPGVAEDFTIDLAPDFLDSDPGATVSGQSSLIQVVIPEPASLAALAAGVGLLAKRRRMPAVAA